MSVYRRILIASNRLPFTIAGSRNKAELRPTTGGLASALGAVHQQDNNLWIGWPGDYAALDEPTRAAMMETFIRQRVVPVPLSGRELIDYYDGVCNSALWPVLHYQLDRLPTVLPAFEAYRGVNERFADAIVAQHQPGDLIWIHDYHLMLAPAMVRHRLPDAQIGFFLHTPFPASDVFRVLPWRRELLDGMLGSTLVGFQTQEDAANFRSAVAAVAGCAVEKSTVIADGRRIEVGAYPIGIDSERLHDGSKPSRRFVRNGCRLLVGVDRLDYTKGIPLRLAAFERLLAASPALHGKVQLLQVAVPSREHVQAYATLKREVEGLIARVNVRFGTPSWTPVRYFPEALPAADLAALYRAADVMLVTSLRDGMNLVAKEFVATREDEDGTLVLSELTGAASELPEALMVNPYSVDEIVTAMTRALEMDSEERRSRMLAMRRRTKGHTVHSWADRFTSHVQEAASGCLHRPAAAAGRVRTSVEHGTHVSLVLPFEGVLVHDVRDAWRAGPDQELLSLLRELTARKGVAVHLLSGFDHQAMDSWFDLVPAVIWAEHGLWRREAEGRRWRRTQWTTSEWLEDVSELLGQFVASTPGAYTESRPNTLVWNYHRADATLARSHAQTLVSLLLDAADALGYEVIDSPGQVEIRADGLSLPRTVQKIVDLHPSHQLLFVGDASTAAGVEEILRPSDIVVDFTGETSARDTRRARGLLRELAEALPTSARELAIQALPRTTPHYLPSGLQPVAKAASSLAPVVRIER